MANSNVVELLVKRADTGETLRLKGREAWTLAHLIGAGETGIIPLDRPAPAGPHTFTRCESAVSTSPRWMSLTRVPTRERTGATFCSHRSKCSRRSLPKTSAPVASPV